MGIDPRRLTDKQVGMIQDNSQRKAVVKGRGFDTAEKRKIKMDEQWERDTHNDYIGFLRRNELAYIHANPAKKSTIQKGHPDFTVLGGERYQYRSLMGEFKRPGEKLSEVQEEYHRYLLAMGCKVFVWYSYEEAVKDTAEFFSMDLPINRTCNASTVMQS